MKHPEKIIRTTVFILTSLILVCLVQNLLAAEKTTPAVYLYVDAAPNAYGSPDYAAWQNAAFAAASTGTFVNMASSIIPCNKSTLNFEIEDEVVYSFGDLGKRLTWIYWAPGYTKADLAGSFQISLFNTWDGEVMDFYDYYYGSTWLTPTNWVDYDVDGDGEIDGVIGVAGMAWWGAYGSNTPEALEADLSAWSTAKESWEFRVKLFDSEYSIITNRKPVRLAKLYGDCLAGAKNHGKFVSCVASATNVLKKQDLISGAEKGFIQSCAANACFPACSK